MTESRVVPMTKVVTEAEKVTQVGAKQPYKAPEVTPPVKKEEPAAPVTEQSKDKTDEPKTKKKTREGWVGLNVQYWTEKYVGNAAELKPLAGILVEKLMDGKWNLAIGRGMHGMSGRAHGVPYSQTPKHGCWSFGPE